jgi:hypothetical protein
MKCEGGPWDGQEVPREVLQRSADSFIINDPEQLLAVIRGVEEPSEVGEVIRIGTYSRARYSDRDAYVWQGWRS